MAVVRLGTCSWADEGLLKNWYPREVRTAEARLRHYAERFDTVEVDSPFYRLPSPETAARWAERTPAEFVFHAKASKEMTGHEETDSRERAFAEFRESLAPLEASGKLRGVLLQFHPRVKKSPEALDELRGVADLLAPLVPLIEFRHRSWMTEEERARHARVPRSSTASRTCRSTRRARARRTSCRASPPRRTTSRTSASTAATGRRGTRRRRRPASASTGSTRAEDLEDWVEPIARLAEEAREVYAMFNNNRFDYAPRSAQVLRGLLDEAGVEATGGVEPAQANATLF